MRSETTEAYCWTTQPPPESGIRQATSVESLSMTSTSARDADVTDDDGSNDVPGILGPEDELLAKGMRQSIRLSRLSAAREAEERAGLTSAGASSSRAGAESTGQVLSHLVSTDMLNGTRFCNRFHVFPII